MSSIKPGIFTFTSGGQLIGQEIADFLGSTLTSPANVPSSEIAARIREAFIANVPIIGVCATGILIRTISPLIRNKQTEPPVIAVSEDGQFVIPLLGGHYSANKLAVEIGSFLNSNPALSTGSYVTLGLALGEPPNNWTLLNPSDIKGMTAVLLRGEKVEILGYDEWLSPFQAKDNIKITKTTDRNRIVVSSNDLPSLVYQKKEYALGVGCIRNCPPDDLVEFVNRNLSELGISQGSIEGIYSIDLKSDEPAIHLLAQNIGVEARFYTPEILETQYDKLKNPSEAVYREVCCHGVSEGACLARAGQDGRLVIEKIKSDTATMALAKLGGDTGNPGIPRGQLSVVGIGPGNRLSRTPAVTKVLTEAEVIVGYKGYLDLLEPLPTNQEIVDFELGEEEKRCRHSLETAGLGKRVVLVCSGDSNIFAMNSLVMELLDLPEKRGGVSARAKRAHVQCLPGITVMQAAAARAGGLIGHDFCVISLSNLLTDENTILDRVRNAAEGDFVISLYNPASRKRRILLEKALEIIRQHRPDNTPVLIARNVEREGESYTLRDLSTFQSEEIDMLTLLIIGNSHTKTFVTNSNLNGLGGQWVYTPRGYNKKIQADSKVGKGSSK